MSNPHLFSDHERRAAALAVARYGVDRARVCAAARSIQRAKTEGHCVDLVSTLVILKLLSKSQADEIQVSLERRTRRKRRKKAVGAALLTTVLAAGQPCLDALATGSEVKSERPLEIRRLGGYRLLRRLGRGGMGSVYLAYHPDQRKHFALKVLPDHLAGDKNYLDRFWREARHLDWLDHPHIVRGFGMGTDDTHGKHFLILEYVDGPSAHTLLQRLGKLTVGDAVHLALDVAHALEYAHSRNVIHRDIKPDNILLTRSGVAKVTDLGLAKRLDEESSLTRTKQSFGTPYYMSYEQAVDAKEVDGRGDIFSLGATLYHFL